MYSPLQPIQGYADVDSCAKCPAARGSPLPVSRRRWTTPQLRSPAQPLSIATARPPSCIRRQASPIAPEPYREPAPPPVSAPPSPPPLSNPTAASAATAALRLSSDLYPSWCYSAAPPLSLRSAPSPHHEHEPSPCQRASASGPCWGRRSCEYYGSGAPRRRRQRSS